MTRERVVVQKLLALVSGSVPVGLALTATLWAGSTLQDMGLSLDRQLAAATAAGLAIACSTSTPATTRSGTGSTSATPVLLAFAAAMALAALVAFHRRDLAP